MAFIGSMWWLWLILTIAFVAYAITIQVRGAKKIAKGVHDAIRAEISKGRFEDAEPQQSPLVGLVEQSPKVKPGSVKSKVIRSLLAMVLGGIFALTFALSIIVNLIAFAAHH